MIVMSLQLLLRTPMSVQWKREEVYDAVWTLRILAAFVVGTGCGIAQLEGFPVIIG